MKRIPGMVNNPGKAFVILRGISPDIPEILLVVQNESNSFQGNVSVINEAMHFTIVADNGITGLYPHDIAIVIIGAASGEKVEDFVVIGMRVLTDTSAGDGLCHTALLHR